MAKPRSVPKDSMAIGYALTCGYPELSEAAAKIVREAIITSRGSTTEASKSLGIAISAYQKWLRRRPDLMELHLSFREVWTHPGRVPAGCAD